MCPLPRRSARPAENSPKNSKINRLYGVNVRDEKNTAEAFERSFNVTYPSFKDVTGKVLLSLSKYVPAQAVPTTVILDEKGRVASRVLGQANPSILKTLVETVTKGA